MTAEAAVQDLQGRLAKAMRAAHRDSGLTKAELGTLLGLTAHTSMSALMAGRHCPNVRTVARVLHALGKRLEISVVDAEVTLP